MEQSTPLRGVALAGHCLPVQDRWAAGGVGGQGATGKRLGYINTRRGHEAIEYNFGQQCGIMSCFSFKQTWTIEGLARTRSVREVGGC
jgi:hypothetical protein